MQRLLSELVTLLVVLDPFSTLPVFLALTRGLEPAPARRMAIRAVAIAGAGAPVGRLVSDPAAHSLRRPS